MFLIMLITISIGYWWGRKVGQRQGLEQGLQTAFTSLKVDSYKKQFCSVCGRGFKQDLRTTITKDKIDGFQGRLTVLYSIALEFDTEQEMKRGAQQLWEKHGITGELEMFPTEHGKFRLHVYSEKVIAENILDRLPGKRIQAKGAYGTARIKERVDDRK